MKLGCHLWSAQTVTEDLHSATFKKMICADHTLCHQISVREYQCTFINVSCCTLRPRKSSAVIYESFFLWWSSLFLPANEPLDTLFRSSLARHCLGPWIALSFNLSRGHFPVLTFIFFSCIELSLSPLFFSPTVICSSPTCMVGCGKVTSLPLKRSPTQPFFAKHLAPRERGLNSGWQPPPSPP